MKKLIFALVAIMCGVCSVNAGEVQEAFCGDKSLGYCIKHYDRQCEAKNYLACFVVGALHLKQEQYSESKKYLEMVCDKANSKDSYQVEFIDGNLGPKVPAIKNMKSACGYLAKHYYNGWGVRQDYGKALHYFKKACDFGNAVFCALAGNAYDFGKGTKIDYKLAKSYYEKSCEMQSGLGCFLLGGMYYDGNGVPQNLSTAKELFGKACDLGDQKGCDLYKELNEKGVK
ncbi:tetratricopeptide repeat protein [Helicobacter sp. 23-1044]